jgi:hypothetical protein
LNKIVFEFTEEMMTIALLANGWTDGWKSGDWVRSDENGDHGGYSLKEAFGRLLMTKNLASKDYNEHWRMERN